MMTTPDQRVGINPGKGCSNVIDVVIETIRESKLFSRPKTPNKWPTSQKIPGSGNVDLDREMTKRFEDF